MTKDERDDKKTAVALVVSQRLSEGSLGKSLSDIAFLANKHDIQLSRQTLHNWYHQVYLPSRSILQLYVYKLMGVDKKYKVEAGLLLAFFQDLWKAAGYGPKE